MTVDHRAVHAIDRVRPDGVRGQGVVATDIVVAQSFADVATIAILQDRAALEAQQLNEQLTHALNSRIVIEQAKGVVAEAAGLDMAEAFNRLRAHARNHNQRLADVARAVATKTLFVGALDG